MKEPLRLLFPFMIHSLTDSRDRLLALCSGLSEAQGALRLTEGSWSISEIIEHLVVTERVAMLGIKRALSQPESAPELLLETIGKSDLIQTRISKVLARVVAPDFVLPSGRFNPWPGALQAFEQARSNTIAMAVGADDSFNTRVIPHPVLGPLTLDQWFHFIAAHTQRHTGQIEAVLAQNNA